MSTIESNNLQSDLTSEERSACDYLVKIISSKIKASPFTKELSFYKSATHYNWKRSDDKKFIKKMDIALRNPEKSRKYIINALENKGYKQIKLELTSSSATCSTEEDWEQYRKDAEKYFELSSEMQKYRLEPKNKKSGAYTYYTLTVHCKTDNKKILIFKTELPYSKKKKLKKAVKILIIIAIIAVILFAAKDAVVKKILGNDADVSFISAVEMIADKIEKEKEKENEIFYFVMADDCNAINIRANPSKSALIVTVVRSHETKLTPTGSTAKNWIQVTVDGETGWVFEDIVKKVTE